VYCSGTVTVLCSVYWLTVVKLTHS